MLKGGGGGVVLITYKKGGLWVLKFGLRGVRQEPGASLYPLIIGIALGFKRTWGLRLRFRVSGLGFRV